MSQVDLYEHEVEKIYTIVQKVQQNYFGKEASGENLLRLQNELVGRLEDLGFGATVDVTPVLEGEPVSVRIDSRLDGDPFDAERKRWEVRKRIEENKDTPADEIEGLV